MGGAAGGDEADRRVARIDDLDTEEALALVRTPLRLYRHQRHVICSC